MQWERMSLPKQVEFVTGVNSKQLPELKQLKIKAPKDQQQSIIRQIKQTAHEGDYRAQCVAGFLCCVGYAKKKAHKKIYGNAVGRLDVPIGPEGTLLYAIGDDYFPVIGGRQDLEEAAYWYRRSAAHMYPQAQILYGDCLFAGEGVEPNIDEAVHLYEEASKLNNAMAIRRLGDCAYLGIGAVQDLKKAVEYFKTAARMGCRDALWRLGDIYLQGDGVEKNVHIAESFYEEAADLGVASAMCMMGDRYFYGDADNTGTDLKKAVKWYKRSAELEDEWGLFALGMCYYHGRGVEKSHKKALKLFLRASRYGCPDALWYLASCYYNGIGTKKNKKKAYNYYLEAVKMFAIYNS